MPLQKPEPTTPATSSDPADEATLAAEVSARHAAQATEQALAKEIAAREAAKEDARAKLCPNCHAEMVRHPADSPHKAGSWHCSSCGACWATGLRQMRVGHSGPAINLT